jgi:hypothetical protein
MKRVEKEDILFMVPCTAMPLPRSMALYPYSATVRDVGMPGIDIMAMLFMPATV